jgi:hypothetical protein
LIRRAQGKNTNRAKDPEAEDPRKKQLQPPAEIEAQRFTGGTLKPE